MVVGSCHVQLQTYFCPEQIIISEDGDPFALASSVTLHQLTEVDSTNLYGLREWRHLGHASLILAGSQTAGRGRRARSWHSPSGTNIYASLVWKEPLNPQHFGLFSQGTALTIAETLVDLEIPKVTLKWPNDVLIRQQKAAGVLCECEWAGSIPQVMIIGFGINVNTPAADLAGIDQPATSLYLETGDQQALPQLAETIGNRLVTTLNAISEHGLWAIQERWQSLSSLAGKWVQVQHGTEPDFVAKVVGLNSDGGLTVQDESGSWHELSSADTTVRILE